MQQTSIKEVRNLGQLNGNGNPLVIVQVIEIWLHY